MLGGEDEPQLVPAWLIHTGDTFSNFKRFLENPELTMFEEMRLLALVLNAVFYVDAVFYVRPVHKKQNWRRCC